MTISGRVLFLLCLFSTFNAAPATGQECADDTSCGFNSCRTPASPAPPNLWGELRPAEGSIPPERDTTDFERRTAFDGRNPYFMSLDVSNGYIFTAIHTGFQIWDGRANPASPTLLSQRDGRFGEFPTFPVNPEEKFPVQDISVPEFRDDVAVVASVGGAGFSIWDTSNKLAPRALYQDYGKSGKAAFATTAAGTMLGFMASEGSGLIMYDVSRARTFATACTEQTPATNCSGVYLGKLGNRSYVSYVHGKDHFVVFSSGAVQRGLEIWNVSNRFSPAQTVSALGNTIVYGVALWSEGGSYYLATREEPGPRLRIYNVSCIASNSCAGGIGSPIADLPLTDPGNAQYFLTFSRAGSRPFLHLGSERSCGGTERREWLFEVANPFQPRDITPPGGSLNGIQTGYWNWYARATRTGFNFAGQRKARFNGDYLYRAAFSYFDIHRQSGSNQVGAFFTWAPTEIYPGTFVTFTDASAGNPTSWQWSFQDANPSFSSSRNPTVSFTAAGLKIVTLTTCGTTCDTVSRTVQVSSAGATVTGVSVSPPSASSCETITFTATGVTGVQPISYSWGIRSPSGVIVATCSSNPCLWIPAPENPSGVYHAAVVVTNSANPTGSTANNSVMVTSTSLGFTSASGAPTADPFTGATVRFHANSQGASEWSWDFDDDNNPATVNFGPFSSDRVNGPNPSHTYTTSGSKSVRVAIRNCAGAILQSNPLVINVNTAGALLAGFQAQGCPFGVCSFGAGQTVGFVDFSQGAPETWSYDWNNTGTSESGCTFGSSRTSPETIHLFTTPGQYRPCLRVTRGSQSDIAIHGRITITPSAAPTMTINGPSHGLTHQTLSFGATTSNCTPSGPWIWSVGDASGSSNSSTIHLIWATPGTKQISVTNAGCAGAQGSATVTISAPSGAPLIAAFNVSPQNPLAGMVTTFDASSSLGSPTAFAWNLGDSSPLRDGAVITHTYSNPGTYNVTLTVARPGSGEGCALGFCTHSETKTIVVTGAGGGCSGDPTALCLGSNGRYKVTARWTTPNGNSGMGTPVRLTPDSGYFWFFNAANVEMIVKALNGCSINQNVWFFAAGMTNVQVETTITDTVSSASTTYLNPQSQPFVPVQDIEAISCTATGSNDEFEATTFPTRDEIAPAAACAASATNLCLNNGRFRVKATWVMPDGTSGEARAVQLTDDSGSFWFFNAENIEMVVKALNGCGINNRYWLFAAGLTNVQVTMEATDTVTGITVVYTNPQGSPFLPVLDINAFSCGGS